MRVHDRVRFPLAVMLHAVQMVLSETLACELMAVIAGRAYKLTVFFALATRRAWDRRTADRPIVVDSCWNVLESESRDFMLKISTRNFCRFAVRIATRDQKKLCLKFNALA
jgi:hypothetical protein